MYRTQAWEFNCIQRLIYKGSLCRDVTCFPNINCLHKSQRSVYTEDLQYLDSTNALWSNYYNRDFFTRSIPQDIYINLHVLPKTVKSFESHLVIWSCNKLMWLYFSIITTFSIQIWQLIRSVQCRHWNLHNYIEAWRRNICNA